MTKYVYFVSYQFQVQPSVGGVGNCSIERFQPVLDMADIAAMQQEIQRGRDLPNAIILNFQLMQTKEAD